MMTDNSRIAHGGKGLYGARVGILMLEARFPRIPGDMGNALTWPFPVLYKVVPGASPRPGRARTRRRGCSTAFLDAAAELVRLGADGITTTCGFLVALPARDRRACRRAGGDLEPDADPADRAHPAAGQAGRRADGQRREPDAAST